MNTVAALNHINTLARLAQISVDLTAYGDPVTAARMQGDVDAAKQYAKGLETEAVGAAAEKPEVTAAGPGASAEDKLAEAGQRARAGAEAVQAGVEEAFAGVLGVMQAAQPLVGALAAMARGK